MLICAQGNVNGANVYAIKWCAVTKDQKRKIKKSKYYCNLIPAVGILLTVCEKQNGSKTLNAFM